MKESMLGAIALLVSLAAIPKLVSASDRPNFVIILADDLGYGDLGGPWGGSARTPHLDRLAKEGLALMDFHSNAPMCTPTRAALLTGRYPQRMGFERAYALRGRETDLGIAAKRNQNEITLATYLRRAGYATGIFGKWHLGKHPSANPVRHGFDEFCGLTCGDGDYFSKLDRFGDADWFHNEKLEFQAGYATHVITDNAVSFLEKHAAQPFSLYVAHLAVHFPWQSPNDQQLPARTLGQEHLNGKPGVQSKLGPHSPDEVPAVMQQMIEELDSSVGRIVSALREKGLDRKTMVFFTSDNGAYLSYLDPDFVDPASKNPPAPDWPRVGSNGRLRGQKTQLYEGGHRVPAIAWWPGRVPAGKVSWDTAMTMDLLPTILELTAIERPAADGPNALDGMGLAPLLFRGEALPARTLFWRTPSQKAVRQGPWKLIGDELYNLEEDLTESMNQTARQTELVRGLKSQLAAWEKQVDGPK